MSPNHMRYRYDRLAQLGSWLAFEAASVAQALDELERDRDGEWVPRGTNRHIRRCERALDELADIATCR